MELINELLKHNHIQGPVTSMEAMEAVLQAVYRKINTVIPDSAILVGGSAAFYYHYQKHLQGDVLMNDLDVSLIHNTDVIKSLHESTKAFPELKVLRDTCTIVPMGVADLHIDLDQSRNLASFRSGSMSKHPRIRFLCLHNLKKFYKTMNRPKDQGKLEIIARYKSR